MLGDAHHQLHVALRLHGASHGRTGFRGQAYAESQVNGTGTPGSLYVVPGGSTVRPPGNLLKAAGERAQKRE